MCLTTPFHLQSFDENSIQVHTAKLEAISKKGANNIDAQLKLESCRPDAHGQLWKVIKATHSNKMILTVLLSERETQVIA